MRGVLAIVCLSAFIVTLAIAADEFGAGAPPWFGWWDSTITVVGQYTLSISPRPGGAAARSGFLAGDRMDLRKQSVGSRIAATYQPVTTRITPFVVYRGPTMVALNLAASTVWSNASFWKLQPMVSRLIANFVFIICAGLIAFRDKLDTKTTVLAFIFVALVGTMLDPSFLAVPDPAIALALFMVSRLCATGVALALLWLAQRRSILTVTTYAAVMLACASDIAVVVGISTARIDPLLFILSLSSARSLLDAGVWMLVLLSTIFAARYSRSARHLIPLPAGLFVSALCFASPPFVHSWFANVAAPAIANLAVPLGVMFVTRETLRRFSYRRRAGVPSFRF